MDTRRALFALTRQRLYAAIEETTAKDVAAICSLSAAVCELERTAELVDGRRPRPDEPEAEQLLDQAVASVAEPRLDQAVAPTPATPPPAGIVPQPAPPGARGRMFNRGRGAA